MDQHRVLQRALEPPLILLVRKIYIKLNAKWTVIKKTILVSFSGTGDFQNSETSATESEITPTSSKTAEKDNESVNAKLVNASNESTEAITSSETKAGDSKDANENSQEIFHIKIFRF